MGIFPRTSCLTFGSSMLCPSESSYFAHVPGLPQLCRHTITVVTRFILVSRTHACHFSQTSFKRSKAYLRFWHAQHFAYVDVLLNLFQLCIPPLASSWTFVFGFLFSQVLYSLCYDALPTEVVMRNSDSPFIGGKSVSQSVRRPTRWQTRSQ